MNTQPFNQTGAMHNTDQSCSSRFGFRYCDVLTKELLDIQATTELRFTLNVWHNKNTAFFFFLRMDLVLFNLVHKYVIMQVSNFWKNKGIVDLLLKVNVWYQWVIYAVQYR